MRINRQIRANKVRVISNEGKQIGVMSLNEALVLAEKEGLTNKFIDEVIAKARS